ncbi:MAG TPA: TA system VapC family ribonuclease toxin [Gemmatimonadaceae bacterium]
MIAVDTNLLVYAHREDSPWHAAAVRWLNEVAEGTAPWAIPWPCLHEFLAIVTHPRIYQPPTPREIAVDQVDAWMEAPGLVLLGEGEGYWPALREAVLAGGTVGGQVHDARVAALCRHHGVAALCTADRDFSRYPGLAVRNPLVA